MCKWGMGIMGVKKLITVICDGWGILQLRIINGRIEELVMNPLENLMKQSNLNARNGLLTAGYMAGVGKRLDSSSFPFYFK
jgi:hypothetical protein|tara:strand:- start:957 stop:1199 length:243 start_codon:yes stop_codon:yes gene_type:complete